MKSNFVRFLFAFVLAASVWGYFLDLECLLNRCETNSVAHTQCVSPAVLPDGSIPPVVLPEFAIIPSLIEFCIPAAPPIEVAAFPELHPPAEYLHFRAATPRRGPPTSLLS